MAVACKCCGKKIGLLTGSNKLSNEYDDQICDNCFYQFKTQLNILEQSQDTSSLTMNVENAIAAIKKCGFSEEVTEYIMSYTMELKQKVSGRLQQEYKNQIEKTQKQNEEENYKRQLQALIDNHMMTTGFDFEGYKIKSYNGVISGSVVIGTGFLSEVGASISDLLGVPSEMFSEKMETARELALKNLINKSAQNGGNAIIGVEFDYITFLNNMIGVVANGTAVVIEKG